MIVASEDALIDKILKRILLDHGSSAESLISLCAGGKQKLQARLPSLIRSCSGGLKVVLCVDLDMEPCVVRLRDAWFPQGVPVSMVFTVAVREADAWLLADPGIVEYLQTRATAPGNPGSIQDPKSALINIAKRSRNRVIREEMVVQEGALARVGPGYNRILGDFVSENWDYRRAAEVCPDLKRLVAKISEF